MLTRPAPPRPAPPRQNHDPTRGSIRPLDNSGVNAQMRISLPCISFYPFLPATDYRICVAKAFLGSQGIPIHLSRSASADQVIDISSVVKIFFSFLVGFLLYFDLSTVCCVITACGQKSLYNRDGSGRIQCLCSSSAGVPKWGLYGVAEQKSVWRTVLYNGFRYVLGYRDWPTLRRLS